MTSKSQLFHTYTPSPSNKKIAVVNGSLATVAGFRDIYITPTLILKNVLHVPKLSTNLVSIQKLNHDLKCYAIFFPSYCVFQEQGSRRRIGLAKERSAKRKNGHLLNTTQTLLFQGNVPKSYWGEAVLTATYMINRIPSRVLDNKSPIEILKSFYPHFKTSNGLTPKVFGCTAFVYVHSQHRDKLDPQAIKCVFLGYSSTQKGYKCYNPSVRKFYISADVTFTENKHFFSKSSLQGEISMMEDSACESFEPLDLPHVLTHGDEEPESSESITLESPNFTTEPVSSLVPASVTHNFPQFPKVYLREKVIPEQKQVQESNLDPGNEITVRSDSPLHTQAGETSTDSTDNLDLDLPIVVKKGTRECTNRPLYPLSHYVSLEHLSPAHKNFIVSLNITIIPNTVSKALTKREWKDAMREEISALEKNKTWEIVERPKGKNIVDCKWIFTLKYKVDGSFERHKARLVAKWYTQTYGVDYQETFAPVVKMNTALYGLKQSPRAWFGRFTKVMKESGYKQSQVTRNDEREKHEVKQRLATEFEIKELSIEAAYSTQGTFISQQKYVIDLLAETGKIGCKPVSTPMDPNHKLGEAKEEPVVDKRMYQRLVGRLIYLAHTRPNIVYSVSVISQFMHDPREPHLQAAYRVLHYLKGNPGKRILFKKNNTLALEAYTDADYAGSLVDRRSTTGYCTFLGGNLVTWRSKK
ncbi:hypothetical protein AAG906_026262 [Vitis piasezkii]